MSASVDSSDSDGAERLSALAFGRIEIAACSEIRRVEEAVVMGKSYDDHKLLNKEDMIDKRMSPLEAKRLFVANGAAQYRCCLLQARCRMFHVVEVEANHQTDSSPRCQILVPDFSFYGLQ